MVADFFDYSLGGVDVGTLLIPVFAGLIGFGTNWVAITMMFHPMTFWGYKLPFTVFGFPVFGWQGTIPSKAAKMGSIAVDTTLMKLGSTYDFYKEMDPDALADFIVANADDEIREIVDDLIDRNYPLLPGPVRALVHSRVRAELPGAVRHLTHEIGKHIDSLVNLKLMVVRYLADNPKLLNRIFQDVGAKEFRFIMVSGLWLGFLLGMVPMALWIAASEWWLVPVGGAAVGYGTNWIALKIIFEPTRPRKIGPITVYGLFLRRQAEVSEAYAEIIAYEVVTLKNIGHAMLHGPSGDRTRRLIADELQPIVDRSIGPARLAIRATRGSATLQEVRSTVASTGVDSALNAMADEEFSRSRSVVMRELLASRMARLSPAEFAMMLRSAFREDEWQLIIIGAMLGFGAGLGQVALTL